MSRYGLCIHTPKKTPNDLMFKLSFTKQCAVSWRSTLALLYYGTNPTILQFSDWADFAMDYDSALCYQNSEILKSLPESLNPQFGSSKAVKRQVQVAPTITKRDPTSGASSGCGFCRLLVGFRFRIGSRRRKIKMKHTLGHQRDRKGLGSRIPHDA